MEDHNLGKELSVSHVLCCNLYTWMDNVSKIASDDIFKKKFDVDFIKSYEEKSDLGYFPKIDVQYPKKLHRLYNDLLFLRDRMGTKKCKSIVCCSHHKRKYFANIRTLKQGLKHGLI